MTELDRLGWAVEGTFEFAGAHVGVRTTSERFWSWLDPTLAAYRSTEKSIPVYSIVTGEDTAAGRTGVAKETYHILYKGTIAIARTRDIRTLVETFRSDLEGYFFEDRDDAIFADMSVVSKGGVSALVPASIVPFIGTLGHRRVDRAGLTFPAETAVAIEPGTGRVIPIERRVQLPEGWMDRLAQTMSLNGRDPRGIVDQPTSIDVVMSIGWGDEPLVPVTKGIALYRLATHVMNLELLGGDAVADLIPVVQEARCYEMASLKPAQMLAALVRIFDGD
jgi:hypothetical protein